jgi:hypothetical protein
MLHVRTHTQLSQHGSVHTPSATGTFGRARGPDEVNVEVRQGMQVDGQ